MLVNPTELHPAYLAGVLDSDGSLTLTIRHKKRVTPNYSAFFQLTWTHTDKSEKVMNQLKEKYGGSVYLPTIGVNHFPNSRPTIKYFLISKKLKPFLEDILPYVHLKKEQTLNILEFLKSVKMGKNKSQELKDLHYSLYLKNKSLNTKNSGDRRDANN